MKLGCLQSAGFLLWMFLFTKKKLLQELRMCDSVVAGRGQLSPLPLPLSLLPTQGSLYSTLVKHTNRVSDKETDVQRPVRDKELTGTETINK